MTYLALIAAAVSGCSAWLVASRHGDWGFSFGLAVFWLVVSVTFLERRAFSELLRAREQEIEKLKHEQKLV